MNPFEMDGCTTNDVAAIVTTMNAIAPMRSTHGARLRNIHQTNTMSPHPMPPKSPIAICDGKTMGTTIQKNHWTMTAATANHNRQGTLTICVAWAVRVISLVMCPTFVPSVPSVSSVIPIPTAGPEARHAGRARGWSSGNHGGADEVAAAAAPSSP
jgi:hypothetical protein